MSRSAARAPGAGPATAAAGACAARASHPGTRAAASAVGTRSGSTPGIAISGSSISCVTGCPVPHRSVRVRATRAVRVSAVWIGLVRPPAIPGRTRSHLPVARLLVAHLALASAPGRSAVLGSIALRASSGACSLLRLSTRRSSTGCPAGRAASLAHRRNTRHRTRCCKYHERSFDRQVCFLLSFLHNKLT